jgi:3-isopropylmalate dehydrogenase
VGVVALERDGTAYPPATHELCDRSAGILFGAVGDPKYDAAPPGKRPEFAILSLRKQFDLFANLRPVRMFPGLEDASSLKPEFVTGLDLVVVRETTSGLYFGQPKRTTVEGGVAVAIDTLVYRAPEIERVARVAFELARARRNRVTSVDKQNVLETGRLWRKTVIAVHAAEYADVELDHLLVDNAAMQLVREPKRFDVLLTENTFGDILSDQAGMLTGSLGIANPVAAILSAALLCRYSLADEASALRIEGAVASVVASGARTRDLVRNGAASLSTGAFTERVLTAL